MGTHTQRKKAWSLALSRCFGFLERLAHPLFVLPMLARQALFSPVLTPNTRCFPFCYIYFYVVRAALASLSGYCLHIDLAMSEGLVGLCMCTGTYHAKDGKNSGGPLLQDNQTTTGANARLLCVVWSRCARCQHQQHQNDNQHQNRLPLQQNVASPHTKHITRKSKSKSFLLDEQEQAIARIESLTRIQIAGFAFSCVRRLILPYQVVVCDNGGLCCLGYA